MAYILSKITIIVLSIICLISTITLFIAGEFGYIQQKYALLIVMTCIIMQTALVTMVFRSSTKGFPEGIMSITGINRGIIIQKNKFDNKHILGDKEILSQNIKSIHPWRHSRIRIAMELEPDKENRPLKFYVIRKCSDDSYEKEIDIIKPSESLRHIFELDIDPKELINFKFSRDTTVKSFRIDELYIP